MAHGHAHTHEHGHALPAPEQVNKAFIIGIALNLIFVLVEATAGFWYDSLALLSDAGHNLSDVISLVLALLAFRMAKVKPNSRYTYGYKKSTVLVSLLNAIILLVAVGIILAESIEKLRNPQPIAGGVIAWVAGVGILINAFTAFLFLKDKERDLNIKGAYLHLMADALVSVGVVISGVIISYTHWYIIDPIIGIAIAIVILVSTLEPAARQPALVTGRGPRRHLRGKDTQTPIAGRRGTGNTPPPYLGAQYDPERPHRPCGRRVAGGRRSGKKPNQRDFVRRTYPACHAGTGNGRRMLYRPHRLNPAGNLRIHIQIRHRTQGR